ncbi:MAG: porin [Aquabacterium sp.]|uniref:porin n=1 Tax=Aquabacterium sp. TaxID=1872578 RepID=UPI003BE901CA
MIAKKSLVAVAALLAAAGAAQAQSSVKLYGLVDMGVASLEGAHDKGDSGRTTQVTSGAMTTSFIGFAGVEDLGGGLKAEFTLESFLAGDTGVAAGYMANKAGGFWSRASSVALSGGFGRVALGQYDNPLFTAGYTYNPFGSSMVVSPTMRHLNYVGQRGDGKFGVGFDTGWVNSVTYESPNLQGFNVVAQAALKEAAGSSTKNSYTLAGSYNAGPLSAMLTYVKAGYTSANTAYPSDQKVWNLGASYDLGVAKTFLQYTDVKTTRVATADADNKDKIWQLGVSVPLNDKAAVLASFGQSKFKTAGSDSIKNEVFSVGYDYALSKRTDVYGAFMNERQTDLESGQSVAIGIRHNF